MQYIKIGSKEHRNASAGVLIGSTITFAIMYSPQPLISLYSKLYGIPPETASLSVSLTTISLALSMLYVSVLAGSSSRKKFMTVSLILTSCLTILASFVDSFYLFLLLRFFEGMTIAGFPSIAMAYLNEEFSPQDIGGVMGYYVAGSAIGGLTGRIIVGALTDLTNWHTAFLAQGIVSLLGSLWFFFYLPDSRNFVKAEMSIDQWKSSLRKTLFNKKLLSMYITGFLMMGAYITILDYIGYPLTSAPYFLSQTLFGFLFVVNIFGVFSSIVFGKLADRYPRKNVLALAIIVLLLGVLLTLVGSLLIKILGVAAVAFGFMAGHSVASSSAGLLAPRENKGQASSFYLLFYYTGSSVLGSAGGLFLNHFNWGGLVLFVCILIIAAIMIGCEPWVILKKSY